MAPIDYEAEELAALGKLAADTESRTSASRATPGSVFAAHILDATLTRRQREALVSSAKVMILETFDEESVELIVTHLRMLKDGPLAVAVEKSKPGTRTMAGANELSVLEHGRSIAFVTSDAAAELAHEVHAAADHYIRIPRPNAHLVRKTIRSVTGSTARGLADSDLEKLGSIDIVAAIRLESTAAQCVANLKKAAAHHRPREPIDFGPKIEELALTRAVRAWSEHMLAAMRDVADGAAPPETLRHVLLEGPPGTGKTTIATALARSAGWPIETGSVAAWFATSDGHLGGVVKAASRFFDGLQSARGPILGFLDEIDGLPNRAALTARDAQWWTPVITRFCRSIRCGRAASPSFCWRRPIMPKSSMTP